MLHIKVGYFYVGLHGLKIWQGNLINSFQKHTTGIRIRITKKNWLSGQTRIGSVQTTHYSSICDLKIYDSFREQIHEYHEKKNHDEGSNILPPWWYGMFFVVVCGFYKAMTTHFTFRQLALCTMSAFSIFLTITCYCISLRPFYRFMNYELNISKHLCVFFPSWIHWLIPKDKKKSRWHQREGNRRGWKCGREY